MTDLENREAFERALKKEHSGVSFWLNTWNGVEQDYNHPTASWAWRMWQASTQREGFKLVPLEPSKEMIKHAEQLYISEGFDIFSAVINAV